MANKNVTISTTELVEGAIIICGGIAFTDICKNAVKQVPHGNGIFKKIGRAALYCGSFMVGVDIAGKAVQVYDKTVKTMNGPMEEIKQAWKEASNKNSEAADDSEAEGEFEEEETTEASDDIFNYEEE